jgi:hypothetical protein
MAFEPQNKLEHSLISAVKDPACRPQFYRELIKSDIYFIEHGNPPIRGGRVTLAQGYQLRIQPMDIKGKSYLPIFSSLPRLRAVLKHEAGYISMNALKFLEITKGADLILNSGSDYGKELTSAEIASILDGSIWKPTEQHAAKKNTSIVIGQPARYPGELVGALKRYFGKRNEVKRAWIAHYYNPETGEEPHTMIALEVSGNRDQIFGETGLIAKDISIPDPPVDLIQITGRGGLDDYFLKNLKPFYEKKLFGVF